MVKISIAEARRIASLARFSQDEIQHPADIAILSLEQLAPDILESGDDEAIIAYQRLLEYFKNMKEEVVTKPEIIMIEADSAVLDINDLPKEMHPKMPHPACHGVCSVFEKWIGSREGTEKEAPCISCPEYSKYSSKS